MGKKDQKQIILTLNYLAHLLFFDTIFAVISDVLQCLNMVQGKFY